MPPSLVKPLRDLAPLDVRVEIWRSATDPATFLEKIITTVTILGNISTQQSLLSRLGNPVLCHRDAGQLRSLLPLSSRFLILASMECNELLLKEVADAMKQEGEHVDSQSPSRQFWAKKSPLEAEPLFALAPDYYKRHYWTDRYLTTIKALESSIATDALPQWSWPVMEAYGAQIGDEDRQLAELWGGLLSENEMAKMLAARCAEKITMRFYSMLGFRVSDIARMQLQPNDRSWKTHDLDLSQGEAVDVKNSRCPTHSDYYVAHDVKHKRASGQEVTLTTVLSPYLQLSYLNKPETIPDKWGIPNVRQLGEITHSQIERLKQTFVNAEIEFETDVEKLVPSWLTEFCPSFYASQNRHIEFLREPIHIPPIEAWAYLPEAPIPSFLRAGMTLPAYWIDRLASWQIELFQRMQTAIGAQPISRPYLYLSILSHFLSVLRNPPEAFDPVRYGELLFSFMQPGVLFRLDRTKPLSADNEAATRHPCGLLDPLARVFGLCETTTELWHHGDRELLRRFRRFRLSNRGLLTGYDASTSRWITLVAYCGGDKLNDAGKWMGKCARYPLVFGREETCHKCGKLVCKCGFCTKTCPELERRERERKENANGQDCGGICNDSGYWAGLGDGVVFH